MYSSIRIATTLLVISLVTCEPAGDMDGGGAHASPSSSLALDTDEAKMLYALGFGMAGQLATLALSEEEVQLVQMGLDDAVHDRPAKVDPKEFLPRLRAFQQARVALIAEEGKAAGKEIAAAAAAEPGAVVTDSGLVFRELQAGEGAHPSKDDVVVVHYHGTLPDGRVFDSSIERGTPARFPVNRVIKCWGEALPMLAVGGKAKITCPSDIAYGDHGAPPLIMPGATLTFEIELLEIVTEP